MDDEDDSDARDGLPPGVNPEDTVSASSDTSDDASVQNFRDSRHDAAHQFTRDVVAINPRY